MGNVQVVEYKTEKKLQRMNKHPSLENQKCREWEKKEQQIGEKLVEHNFTSNLLVLVNLVWMRSIYLLLVGTGNCKIHECTQPNETN